VNTPVNVHVNGFGFIGMLVVQTEDAVSRLENFGIESVLDAVTFPLSPHK
jgi:ATP adenylyltransferase/5',5'''-P-1,P-4-tetraphosphate phosphorylase II